MLTDIELVLLVLAIPTKCHFLHQFLFVGWYRNLNYMQLYCNAEFPYGKRINIAIIEVTILRNPVTREDKLVAKVLMKPSCSRIIIKTYEIKLSYLNLYNAYTDKAQIFK